MVTLTGETTVGWLIVLELIVVGCTDVVVVFDVLKVVGCTEVVCTETGYIVVVTMLVVVDEVEVEVEVGATVVGCTAIG